MPEARQVTLCKEVLAWLQATPWPFGFSSYRRNLPIFNVEDSNSTQIIVWPGQVQPANAEVRGKLASIYGVNLTLANFLDTRLNVDDLDEQDDALYLMELIQRGLYDTAVDGMQFLEYADQDTGRPSFDDDQTNENNVFLVQITARFYEYW